MNIPAQTDEKSAVIEAPPDESKPLDSIYRLLDSLPVMAWTATHEGTLNFINQQWYDYTGCPRDRLPGLTLFTDWVHPQDHLIVYQSATDLVAKGSVEFEFRLRRHDGEYRRCRSRAVEIREGASPAARWIGTTVDVEDVRRAADELKLKEEHYQLALESADVGIWRLELPSMKLTVDERTRRHLDFDSNVITNYQPQNHIHPHDYEYATTIQMVPGNERYETERRVKQRDGTYRWQAAHWRVYFEGEGGNATPALVTGTSMDITARKEAAAEKEELDLRYRLAMDTAALGTWSYNFATDLVHIDARARAHLGVDQPALTREQMLALIHELDREATLQSINGQLRNPEGDHRATTEFRVRHANGEVRWISEQIYLEFADDGSGRPVRTIGVTRDITARKHAEEQLQQLNSDLELRVQQRTAELTAANQELESFAYTVSHDLRSPLRAMWGFCDALIEDYGPTLPPEAHQYLQQVIDGSRHLGEIINGLLALSRSTRGVLRRDQVDLSDIAEKIMREMAHVEPDRRVTWTIQPKLRACGDSRMIYAVMQNLLGNAWKYTAHRTDAVVRVYSDYIDDEYVFCVEDNGVGFNMEHAGKLFQPFQRLHRLDEFSSLGIGLATVQRIIHRHGGKVCGIGVAGQGATFRFSLPLPGWQAA